MNVTRKLLCCATFIYAYLVATSTDTTSTVTSLTFDRQRHVASMCHILCRHSYGCIGVGIVKSELKCNMHGLFQRTYFFNCSRDKETHLGYIKDLSKKEGLKEQKAREEKQVKATGRNEESKGQSSKCKGRMMWYVVDVVTGRSSGAGTSCNIFLILQGTRGMITQKLQKKGYVFTTGSTGHFEFLAKCVGNLRNIKVKIVKKGFLPYWAWNLDTMTVSVTDGKYTEEYFTSPKIWLGDFKGSQTEEVCDLDFTHSG